MIKYAVSNRLVLDSGNAMHNDSVVGVVAPTTLAGFGHKIDRDLKASGSVFSIEGMGVVVHTFDRPEGHPKYHPHRKELAASIVDTLLVHAEISLFVKIGTDPSADLDEIEDDDWNGLSLKLGQDLSGGILGGGVFQSKNGKPQVEILEEDAATRRLLRNGKGFVLKDASHILEAHAVGHNDPLSALISILRWDAPEESLDGKRSRKTVPDAVGTLVPIAIGFAPIEAPKARKARMSGDTPHVYAESVTTLGTYLPIKSLALTESGPKISDAAWRYRTLDGGRAIIARTS